MPWSGVPCLQAPPLLAAQQLLCMCVALFNTSAVFRLPHTGCKVGFSRYCLDH